MDSPQEAVTTAEQRPRDLHVMICMPVHGGVYPATAWAMTRAAVYFAQMPYDGTKKIAVEMCKSSNICEGRTRLVARAFSQGATHILWVDSDMKFREDVIPALLNHGKPIVGLNYPTKEMHSRPTAYQDSNEYVGPLWTKEESEGLAEVSHIGFGCLLVDMSVFDALDLPYFEMKALEPDYVATKTEDVYFCEKAREAGYQIFVDQDLSRQVAHVGDFEYTNFMANEAETVHQALYRELK